MQTTGGATGNETTVTLDVPELDGLGPRMSKARVHWAVDGATSDLRMQIKGRWSVRGLDTWSPTSPFDFSDVFNGSSDPPQTIDAWKTDDSNWGLHLRAELWAWNNAQGSQLTARVWAYLEVELKT